MAAGGAFRCAAADMPVRRSAAVTVPTIASVIGRAVAVHGGGEGRHDDFRIFASAFVRSMLLRRNVPLLRVPTN